MTKRKRCSAEFKAKVALEAVREVLTTAEVAKKCGVHPTMISGWKRTVIENTASAFGRGASAITRRLGKAAWLIPIVTRRYGRRTRHLTRPDPYRQLNDDHVRTHPRPASEVRMD